jgi:uncharacterized protein Yka (UPF0111/DUF47 family)
LSEQVIKEIETLESEEDKVERREIIKIIEQKPIKMTKNKEK